MLEHLFIALASETPGQVVPDWIELIPSNPIGRDGRAWILSDPMAVAIESLDDGYILPVDWEHSTEIRAPKGEESPAAGWISEMKPIDGAVWGKVEWTTRASEQIARREYRFISPAILYDPKTREIKKVTSVGLTNRPNFSFKALNSEVIIMPIPIAILQVLGLPEEATEQDVIDKIKNLMDSVSAMEIELTSAVNRAESPALEKFVPRGDYDALLERANNAERELVSRKEAQLETEIDSIIADALRAGKITPATKGFYVELCHKDNGINQFRDFLKVAPSITNIQPITNIPPNRGLNDQQLAICRKMGISPEKYIIALNSTVGVI